MSWTGFSQCMCLRGWLEGTSISIDRSNICEHCYWQLPLWSLVALTSSCHCSLFVALSCYYCLSGSAHYVLQPSSGPVCEYMLVALPACVYGTCCSYCVCSKQLQLDTTLPRSVCRKPGAHQQQIRSQLLCYYSVHHARWTKSTLSLWQSLSVCLGANRRALST